MKPLAPLLRKLTHHHKLAWQITLWSLVALVGLAVTFFIANPPPPRTIHIATGADGGAYHEFGKRYRDFFAKHGIDVQLVQTKGAQENADHLLARNDPVAIAFMQSGLINPEQAADARLETLGSIGYEPIWIFYRGQDADGSLQRFTDFANRKVAIGEQGSGTYTEAMHMLSLNGLDTRSNLLSLSTQDAINALERGDIDAILLI